MHGKCHTESIITLGNYVALLSQQNKRDEVQFISGWFSGKPLEAYIMQESGNERLLLALRNLERGGIDVMGLGSDEDSEVDDEDEDSECSYESYSGSEISKAKPPPRRYTL